MKNVRLTSASVEDQLHTTTGIDVLVYESSGTSVADVVLLMSYLSVQAADKKLI